MTARKTAEEMVRDRALLMSWCSTEPMVDAVPSDDAAEIAKAYAAQETQALRDAAIELLEVADLRGEADLPHPADDPKLWTARMQEAWDELRAALERGEGSG